MKIIVIGSIKGGTGKTTIATNLAVGLAKQKKKVLLVDSDPQESAMAWRLLRNKNDSVAAISIATPTLHKDITAIGASFDYVIIDVGGRDNEVLRSAFIAADLIIIPVLASPYDIWSAYDTIAVVDEAEAARGHEVCTRLALNQVIVNSVILREALEALNDEILPPCVNTFIHMRMLFKIATTKGLSILEMRKNKKTEKAITEMQDFTEDILLLLEEEKEAEN